MSINRKRIKSMFSRRTQDYSSSKHDVPLSSHSKDVAENVMSELNQHKKAILQLQEEVAKLREENNTLKKKLAVYENFENDHHEAEVPLEKYGFVGNDELHERLLLNNDNTSFMQDSAHLQSLRTVPTLQISKQPMTDISDMIEKIGLEESASRKLT